MSLLLITDERFLDHDAGPGHPERPDRLRAVWAGIDAAGLGDSLERMVPEVAPLEAVLEVHEAQMVDDLVTLSSLGGGRIDADTVMGPESWTAARLAAGSGLAAISALDGDGDGDGDDAAFCAVRPPGHHATPTRPMGFCLLNNVAIAAAALAARGERVLIVDYDAHHGNGTQAVFYGDPRVMYVSFHQSPLYPGTGSVDEAGEGEAVGTTVNVPFPPGTTGDRYRAAWELLAPVVAGFGPSWCLVSAGFDAHRADPLTDMGLSSGDFGDLTADIVAAVPGSRRLVFLEGGYELRAVAVSTAAVARALVGDPLHPERPTSGGPGEGAVRQLASLCAGLAP